MRLTRRAGNTKWSGTCFWPRATSLPSGRSVTHTGGGLAANSTANDHTDTATLTGGDSSYVLTRTIYDRARAHDGHAGRQHGANDVCL